MIEHFIFTFIAMGFFATALGIKIAVNYKKGMLISSCHQLDGNQNCECFSQEEEKKKILKENVLKRARASLVS